MATKLIESREVRKQKLENLTTVLSLCLSFHATILILKNSDLSVAHTIASEMTKYLFLVDGIISSIVGYFITDGVLY